MKCYLLNSILLFAQSYLFGSPNGCSLWVKTLLRCLLHWEKRHSFKGQMMNWPVWNIVFYAFRDLQNLWPVAGKSSDLWLFLYQTLKIISMFGAACWKLLHLSGKSNMKCIDAEANLNVFWLMGDCKAMFGILLYLFLKQCWLWLHLFV